MWDLLDFSPIFELHNGVTAAMEGVSIARPFICSDNKRIGIIQGSFEHFYALREFSMHLCA